VVVPAIAAPVLLLLLHLAATCLLFRSGECHELRHRHHHHRSSDGSDGDGSGIEDRRQQHAGLSATRDNDQRQLFHHRHHGVCGARDPTREERDELSYVVEEYKRHKHRQRQRGLQREEDERFVVPVFFHSFAATKAQKLTWKQARQFVTVLNKEYEPTPFRFQLKLFQNYLNPDFYACSVRNETTWKPPFRIKGSNALNIYMCNHYEVDLDLVGDNPLGYAYFPNLANMPRDGVTIMPLSAEGPMSAHYNVVHEVGHWLGLLHTFSGGCEPGARVVNGLQISDGDGVDDTPAHSKATFVEEQWNTCWVGQGLDTCPDSIEGIDKGLDPVTNFMNYVPASCFRDFGTWTDGQIVRMVALYKKFRLKDPWTCYGYRQRGCTTDADCCGSVMRCLLFRGKYGQSKRCTAPNDPHVVGANGRINKHNKVVVSNTGNSNSNCRGLYASCRRNSQCCGVSVRCRRFSGFAGFTVRRSFCVPSSMRNRRRRGRGRGRQRRRLADDEAD